MPSLHKDFPLESQRLAEGIERVAHETMLVSEIEKKQYKEVLEYRQNSGGSYSHEWFVAEKKYAITSQKLKDLHHARGNPWFARVDFKKTAPPTTKSYTSASGASPTR
jgi:DNA helicase II / ATP-dependent DNA helicase PcrA